MLARGRERAAEFVANFSRRFSGNAFGQAIGWSIEVASGGTFGGVGLMAGQALGQSVTDEVFKNFTARPQDEQLRTSDELVMMTPEEAAAVARAAAEEEFAARGDELRRLIAEELARRGEADAARERAALEALKEEILAAAAETGALVPGGFKKAISRPGVEGVPKSLPGQLPRTPWEMQGFLPERVPALRSGTELPGNLVLERLIGQGGFGEVWLARHTILELDRAVKFCLDADLQASLRNDMKMMAKLMQAGGHPNIVKILDAAIRKDAPPYLVMEYEPGGDLLAWADRFGGDAVPVDEAVEVLRQVAEGLAFAHGLGIVHRDLKPANILVGADGTFRLCDLGIAVLAGPDGVAPMTGRTRLTSAGSDIYTDRRRGYGPPVPADDIYALGVLGAQLLLPDERDEDGELAVSRFTVHLPAHWQRDLSEAGVPADLVDLLGAAMDRRDRRPADGAAFLGRLRALGGASGNAPASRAEARPVEPVADEPAARWEPLSVFRDRLKDGSEGPEMVVIPAGKFVMGAPKGEAESGDAERPQHEVTFAEPFALGENAVTFDFYDRFCEATGTEKPADQGWGRGGMPVINVSWHEAKAYCAWLSEETGSEYRLPSEAEWEYACRAGTKTPFFFGETIATDQANYNGNHTYGRGQKGVYRERTVPVSEIADAVNAWGLRHMHGNVWEWCEDWWHGSYVRAPQDGRPWLDANGGDSTRRVVRGGSWGSGPRDLRSAGRGRVGPEFRGNDSGFRLARTLLTP